MQPSLVKYSTPISIANVGVKSGKKGLPSPKAAVEEVPGMTQTEDILNSILPPREWADEDRLWVQYVSSTPATRVDVVTLQLELDKKLQERQARETGICPVREDLYAQAFDELIRQMTISCAERGLLALRVRDEVRMTVSAYQSLYESSIAFGIRKALMAEQRRFNEGKEMEELLAEIEKLEDGVKAVEEKITDAQEGGEVRRGVINKKHEDEVERLRKENSQLKEQLETLLAVPKSK
ncbi:28 kDa inner dynein arm light chain, axonemal, putative [Perkinsus marinus ATCC 50983]|uniref:28 kDa inner dynein arm light chain, axonemal, putative n=1 Tax=Perkinsus marinus (strain ATCC 50983 / TXsc) TaxID=423536 RepID=C5LMW4_PERM5|nr:28 kDa inner dynein arm light chain, axonemal, putative [Perkinsus marinus ATCC 50983]EER02005.1 28 kDa inner dynein arm light chain, axonemal, putative [Perkinsus marinus ATCC 50983]|eukprot:XP_002769287.1 28 kDa inner dynein arm light chain, axonemal, putative [Perkinsus marinus ATCC 50983]